MEPNNFENQIKDKLNSREIQPSLNSWDRLDAMLTVHEEKKTKRFPFLFIGIAASVLVLLSVGLFLFNQKDIIVISDKNNVVTNEKSSNNAVKNSKTDTLINQKSPNQVTPNNQIVVTNSTDIQSSTKKQSTNNNGVSIIKNNQSQQISTSQNQQQIVQLQSKKEEVSSSKEVSVNPEIQLTSIDDVAKNQLQKTSTIKVNAGSLLYQVDGELNQSFRQKVIAKISKNYQDVKVTLANRNQQN